MSESRDDKLKAIDEVLQNNPDMRPEFKAKLEGLRAKIETIEIRRGERIETHLAEQAERKKEFAERRERVLRRSEEYKAFDEEWKEHRRLQADLIRRIAAKL